VGFDAKRFMENKLVAREGEVRVPDMSGWFADGDEPVWRVRGLTGKELGRADEAAARNLKVNAILEGIVGGSNKKPKKALKQMVDPDTPQDVARRIELFIMRSVDPPADLELAKKVCREFPIEFKQITNKVIELTGSGHVLPGKSKPSGKTRK